MLKYTFPIVVSIFLGTPTTTPVYSMEEFNAGLEKYFNKSNLVGMPPRQKNILEAYITEVITNEDLKATHKNWVIIANQTIELYVKARGGTPNVHEFVRYFDMIRPQFSLVFWEEFHPEQPDDFLTSLTERIGRFEPAQGLGTVEYINDLVKTPCPDNKTMLQLLWESWYLAEFIDERNGDTAKRQSFIETLPNIGIEDMCGTGKPNNVFYILQRHLLQDALELLG